MAKHFILKKYPLIFLFSILSGGCINTDKKLEPAITEEGKVMNIAITAPAVASFGGYLDTLWTDSLSFSNLPEGKEVFVFTFRDKDTLTLHGWDAKGLFNTGFDSIPDIRLYKGRPSNLNYGSGTYFGNVILNDAKKIKKILKKENAQYVLFAPKKLGEHISYEILVGKENPIALIKKMIVIPTNVTANPSPPKNY